jgi:hypothetical protein
VGRADVNGNVAIIGVDSDSEEIKYRDVTAGADRTVVTTDQVQTLTNKTITAPVGTEKAEVVTAANVITAAESGTTFYLSAAAGFLSTLPAPALGLWFRFVTKTTPTSNGYTIGTPTADIIFGSAVGRDGAAGVAGSAEDLITLTANNTLPGDEVVLRSDGTNWYAIAQVDVAAAITFTVT